ncbi:MAG: FAD-dependent oxidoreductase, partial [Anaerolineales bacterium]|nr:FAD-dependent oxidoreductase [Anaerolineales bacterium]
MANQTSALVIGAGIAGLTAAYQLQKRGLEVRVLEARDHVGGRM